MTQEEPDAYKQLMHEKRELMLSDDPISLITKVYQLWWHWADIQLFIVSPTMASISPPHLILPQALEGSMEFEFVYPIHDYGYMLASSKAIDMYNAGMSMCRLHYTIEKMVVILMERLQASGIGGDDLSSEVQVALNGHELAKRKAFEVIMNLKHNVVITNFNPVEWGDRFLETVKRMAKDYGYLSEAPRDTYRSSHASSIAVPKSGKL